MTLLAELHHHEDRLNLGRPGRELFVFHCANDPGLCDDWDAEGGGNAAFVLEPEQLVGRLAAPREKAPEYPDVRILGWAEISDGLPLSIADEFMSDELRFKLPREVLQTVTMGTRIGGVPAWIQSAEEAPKGFRFVAQLDSGYSFYRPFPPLAARKGIQGHPDQESFEGRTWWAQGPNFGDGGIGYLFLRGNSGLPEARFFWQCG